MNQERTTLSIDTGAMIIDIEDTGGDIIGQFRFNPNDFDIVRRYEYVAEELRKIVIPEDATTNDLFTATDKIKELFDYLLNYKVSDSIFKKCNPLTLTANGDFYAENVLTGITNLIEKTMDTRLKAKRAKIAKATEKYHE
jgi:hypothetical protein